MRHTGEKFPWSDFGPLGINWLPLPDISAAIVKPINDIEISNDHA
jgi:hypothetical protein